MERRTTYRRSTRLIILFAAVLLGLGWARIAPQLALAWVLVAAGIALLTFKKARTVSLYAVLICGFFFGWWRGSVYMGHIHELAAISKKTVTITGTALSDSIYSKSQL